MRRLSHSQSLPGLSTSGMVGDYAVLYVDRSKSRESDGYGKHEYAALVRLAPNDTVADLRVLVDKSIVEAFAMRGRVALTSRVYPTRDDAVHVAVASSRKLTASAHDMRACF